MYKYLLKPVLFFLSPEKAHYLALTLFRWALRIPGLSGLLRSAFRRRGSVVNVAGLNFPNRIGLAAGFDKDGKYADLMAHLGFGHIEIGTVTPLAQPGNPKPRLFRLPKDNALINRMGFNNDGLDAMVRRLEKGRPEGVILGANIGKNKITPNEDAYLDYIKCFEGLHHLVDYFVVNVSSPNTPGLRDLQEKEPLLHILNNLQNINRSLDRPRPIFLKIAPDLNDDQLRDITEIVMETDIAGVVATNTTISREGLKTSYRRVENIGNGGLSGQPVFRRSTEVLQYLRKALPPSKAIIGVGGIMDEDSARQKLLAGADLVQIYTGLIYEGPELIGRVAGALNRP